MVFYHVNSPLNSLSNRRWFIATDLQVTRWQLKDLNTNDAIVESKPKTNMSPHVVRLKKEHIHFVWIDGNWE